MVDIDSEHDGEEVIESLAGGEWVAVAGAIACGAVEHSVGSEGEVAAVVTVGFPFEDDQFAVGISDAVFPADGPAGDAIAFCLLFDRSVADDEQPAVLRVLWMEAKSINQRVGLQDWQESICGGGVIEGGDPAWFGASEAMVDDEQAL